MGQQHHRISDLGPGHRVSDFAQSLGKKTSQNDDTWRKGVIRLTAVILKFIVLQAGCFSRWLRRIAGVDRETGIRILLLRRNASHISFGIAQSRGKL